MGNLEKKKGERVHTRSIRIDTFAVDEGHVIVEGVLEDARRPSRDHRRLRTRRTPATRCHWPDRAMALSLPRR